MKKNELLPLDRLHPLVAILTKALEVKEKLSPCLEGGKQLASALLDRAIAAHSEPGVSPYSYLLVRQAHTGFESFHYQVLNSWPHSVNLCQ